MPTDFRRRLRQLERAVHARQAQEESRRRAGDEQRAMGCERILLQDPALELVEPEDTDPLTHADIRSVVAAAKRDWAAAEYWRQEIDRLRLERGLSLDPKARYDEIYGSEETILEDARRRETAVARARQRNPNHPAARAAVYERYERMGQQ